MSTTPSTANAFIDALIDRLAERPGLAGVQISSAYLGDRTDPKGSLQVISVTADEEWGALGTLRREEVFEVDMTAWARTDAFAERDIRAVRDRVFALLGEVADELRTRPQGQREDATVIVREAALVRWVFDQGAVDKGGRWAQLDFTIRCEATLPKT